MGRSPVFATRSTTTSRPSLIVISASEVRISPGIKYGLSPDRLVDTHELRAVRECCLDLDLANHLRHALHDVVTSQHVSAGLHEGRNRVPIPGTLHDGIADECHGLRMIQLDTALE